MRILLTGASGFIGRHLAVALRARGHVVVEAARAKSGQECPDGSPREPDFNVDFAHDLEPSQWLPRVSGMEAVINTVGIFRERRGQTFQTVHVDAASALFQACVMAGVRRVIQFSALGADAGARTPYHLSKRRADELLSTLPIDWTIVQPSLVFGADGTSAASFLALGSLPVIPLPGGGQQPIQPVHIEDLVAGVATLLDSAVSGRRVVPFVGPHPLSLRQYLATLRCGLGLPKARYLPVPLFLVRLAAQSGRLVPGSLLTPDSLQMLSRGNTADPHPLQRLLGRESRSAATFIAADEAPRLRTAAQLVWLLPMLRLSIAAVWIVTGIVSLGFFPVQSSYDLLGRVGVPAALRPLFLYSAAALDIVLGLAILLSRRRRVWWLAQIALIVLYTILITARMPEFWLHPYGPLLKNLPMLAGIYLLYRFEKR